MEASYARWRKAVKGEPLPALCVDLDALDRNAGRVRERARAAGKSIRIATKSIRVPSLLRYLLEQGEGVFRGLLCYSPHEALFLAEQGFDDLLVAYPFVGAEEAEAVRRAKEKAKKLTLMIDSIEHLAVLGEDRWDLCIDVDLSLRRWGVHLGVQRSPLRSLTAFQRLVKEIQHRDRFSLKGVMGYEAQIAGLTDKNPFFRARNIAARLVKAISRADVCRRRKEISQWLSRQGVRIDFFNGGGSGSLKSTLQEPWITEVTVGSGFLQSHLFDYYEGNENEPALAIALRVTRIPQPGMVTCQSGGFVASGAASPDKSPIPYLPKGLRPLKDEGFGEVQTPFRLPAGLSLGLGDIVFLRPAKAGEIMERFSHVLLVREGRVVDRVPTYRGWGRDFY